MIRRGFLVVIALLACAAAPAQDSLRLPVPDVAPVGADDAFPVAPPSETSQKLRLVAPFVEPPPLQTLSILPPEDSRQHDELPLFYEQMNELDKTGLQEYGDIYDGLPLEKKVLLYSRHFQHLYGRMPNFRPDAFAVGERAPPAVAATPAPEGVPEKTIATEAVEDGMEAAEKRDDQTGDQTDAALASDGENEEKYDELPLTYAEMNKNDQIIMRSFRKRYDALLLWQKARLYSREFEKLRNRKPVFHPDTVREIEISQGPSPEAVKKKKKDMYTVSVPKASSAVAGPGTVSGPWGKQDSRPAVVPSGRRGKKLENLRQGWNAFDALRDGQEQD